MRFRFFLVAPGDFISTPKLAEVMAMGGTGGPLPVIVLPAKVHTVRMLPYADRIDYCSFAFIVSAKTAKTNMRGVLERCSLYVILRYYTLAAVRSTLPHLCTLLHFTLSTLHVTLPTCVLYSTLLRSTLLVVHSNLLRNHKHLHVSTTTL